MLGGGECVRSKDDRKMRKCRGKEKRTAHALPSADIEKPDMWRASA